jgi:hypothetical protein
MNAMHNTNNIESIAGTLIMYASTITLTGVMYSYFAPNGCSLNQFFVTFNLILGILITLLCILPSIQEANSRSGLSQASIVVIYCTYLVLSAVANEPNDKECNPLRKSHGPQTTTIVLGAVFTFLAVAYSTSRAATQGGALVNKTQLQQNHQPIELAPASHLSNQSNTGVVTGSSDREHIAAAVESG